MGNKLAIDSRYQVGPEIGRGSFGVVYEAKDIETGEQLAIKFLLPWAKDDPATRHRLKREAKLTQMLKSEHAVRIHHVGENEEGDLYMVMELLDGVDLTEVLQREAPLDPDRVARVAIQALDALDESHRLGVVHRDLKPHNILLCRNQGEEDWVKVLDFGIAKVAGTSDGTGLRETTKLTVQGGVLGTPVYMSPEQCRGEALTSASDLYSLGIVLYEMLTGRAPFDHENPVQVMIMQNNTPLPPLPAHLASTRIGKATMQALEKHPDDRFATAADMSAAIGGGAKPRSAPTPSAASETPSAAAKTTAAANAPTQPQAGRQAPSGSQASRPDAEVRPGQSPGDKENIILMGIVAVAVIAAIAFAVYRLL